MTIVRSVCLVAILLVATGCESGTKSVPVSGTITLDGQPLANAFIAFQPKSTAGKTAGVGSYGNSDATGNYTLHMSDTDKPGAIVGTHRVEITLKAESDDRDPRLRPKAKVLPPKYNRDSELEFTVEPSGSSAANFTLKSQ